MWMLNMNYASLLLKVLDIAINDKFINYAGQGDIYEINSLNVKDYPIFWVSITEQVIERDNYIEYPLTMYYIDREKFQNDDVNDTDQPLIHSNGVIILGNIIRKIKEIFRDELLNEIGEINYTLWGDTEIFSDKCSGVYTMIRLALPKETNCVIE